MGHLKIALKLGPVFTPILDPKMTPNLLKMAPKVTPRASQDALGARLPSEAAFGHVLGRSNAQLVYQIMCFSMMLWRLFFASPSGRVFVGSLSCNSLLFRCAQKGAQAKNAILSMRKRVSSRCVLAPSPPERRKKQTNRSKKNLRNSSCFLHIFLTFLAPQASLSKVPPHSRTEAPN